MVQHFTRAIGGRAETLHLVRLDSDGSLAVAIYTGTPATKDKSLVGAFDLDMDEINASCDAWHAIDGEITEREAIAVARRVDGQLRAHADPSGAASRAVSIEEAERIAEDDPALVYLPQIEVMRMWESGSVVVEPWSW